MVYSDSSTKLGIVQEIHSICNSDATMYPVADITRRVNAALDDYIQIALSMDKLHQWDDTNITSLPIATFDIVSGQRSYALNLDQGNYQILKIHKLYVKDSSGLFSQVNPLNVSDSEANETFQDNSTQAQGSPKNYTWFAGSLFLDPIPNYNSTAGGKIIYQRTGSYFTASDTTKVPGIPYMHHMFLARKAAIPFLVEKQRPQKNDIMALLAQDEKNIENYYRSKSADSKNPRLKPNIENTR